jgi:hypothetical protein
MPRKPPRLTEPDDVNKKPKTPARCICLGGHTPGLARATRKTKGEYYVEPSTEAPVHWNPKCHHSELFRTTPRSYIPPVKSKRPRRQIDRIVT